MCYKINIDNRNISYSIMFDIINRWKKKRICNLMQIYTQSYKLL